MEKPTAKNDVTISDCDIAAVVRGSNQFALDLYSQLRTVQGNLFFSPHSISLALAMVCAGGEGETADEIAKALGLSLPREKWHKAFKGLRESTKTDGIELQIANRLWGQKGYYFLPEYLEQTQQCYGSGLAEVDFKGDSEQARLQINTWVEEQTAGKIKNLLQPEHLNDLNRLVLTNAIYFLGSWEYEFYDFYTKQAPFFLASGERINVKMMNQDEELYYGEYGNCQVLELPYIRKLSGFTIGEPGSFAFSTDNDCGPNESCDFEESYIEGNNFVMNIILPKQVDGLAELENNLSSEILDCLDRLEEHPTEIYIPKFRIEDSHMLVDVLRSMGINKAFDIAKADFSLMTDDPEGLFISEVIHKAFVDVNEKGTEAAAATACVMLAGGIDDGPDPEDIKVFRADHPFIFMIRDCKTHLIHFMGRVESLENEEEEE